MILLPLRGVWAASYLGSWFGGISVVMCLWGLGEHGCYGRFVRSYFYRPLGYIHHCCSPDLNWQRVTSLWLSNDFSMVRVVDVSSRSTCATHLCHADGRQISDWISPASFVFLLQGISLYYGQFRCQCISGCLDTSHWKFRAWRSFQRLLKLTLWRLFGWSSRWG